MAIDSRSCRRGRTVAERRPRPVVIWLKVCCTPPATSAVPTLERKKGPGCRVSSGRSSRAWSSKEVTGSFVVRVRLQRRDWDRCGICRRRCPDYEAGDGRRRWRVLNLGTTKAYLETDAPRVRCPRHGIVAAAVRRACHGSGRTSCGASAGPSEPDLGLNCLVAPNTFAVRQPGAPVLAQAEGGLTCRKGPPNVQARRLGSGTGRRIGVDLSG